MLGLTLLFLGTLTVIYLSSFFEMRADNFKMLERHAQSYDLRFDGHLGIFQPNEPGGKPFDEKPSFQLSTFYSVAISYDGRVLATDTGNRQLYDEQTLQCYAENVLNNGKTRGTKGSLLYLIEKKNGYSLVVFMDNTIVQERMTMLLRNTLIFGGGAMVALFFLAVYLAKRIVRPLEESYQKQKQFISDAGHELKTPVSVVSANAEILGRQLGKNQWLSNIQYENERMGSLVKQLLDLAKMENVQMQMEHLDFSRLVSGESLPFETVAFEQGMELKTDIAPDMFLHGDAGKLKQLVSILIDNAIDHSPKGAEVWVRLYPEHANARLSVINEGARIPKAQCSRIFERFYRMDDARSDSGHFGLGLAIAKAIADGHRGKICVDCYEGKVEFSVWLPLQR